jgi:hypothetical protein
MCSQIEGKSFDEKFVEWVQLPNIYMTFKPLWWQRSSTFSHNQPARAGYVVHIVPALQGRSHAWRR